MAIIKETKFLHHKKLKEIRVGIHELCKDNFISLLLIYIIIMCYGNYFGLFIEFEIF
jgi:hypothetical protein